MGKKRQEYRVYEGEPSAQNILKDWLENWLKRNKISPSKVSYSSWVNQELKG